MILMLAITLKPEIMSELSSAMATLGPLITRSVKL